MKNATSKQVRIFIHVTENNVIILLYRLMRQHDVPEKDTEYFLVSDREEIKVSQLLCN
jgi:hypothetical protein